MGRYILKDIKIELNEKSIKDAIKAVHDFEKKLKPAMECLLNYLAEKGVEIAKAELIFQPGPPYMTGALQDSIRSNRISADRVEITAGEGLMTEYGSYAMFVEYGTGIVGEGTHPEPNGYQYDVNGHGHAGWWYPAPWGTSYGKGGIKYAWTDGMPARPFMYNTFRDLEAEAEASGAKVIAEYIRGERA